VEVEVWTRLQEYSPVLERAAAATVKVCFSVVLVRVLVETPSLNTLPSFFLGKRCVIMAHKMQEYR